MLDRRPPGAHNLLGAQVVPASRPHEPAAAGALAGLTSTCAPRRPLSSAVLALVSRAGGAVRRSSAAGRGELQGRIVAGKPHWVGAEALSPAARRAARPSTRSLRCLCLCGAVASPASGTAKQQLRRAMSAVRSLLALRLLANCMRTVLRCSSATKSTSEESLSLLVLQSLLATGGPVASAAASPATVGGMSGAALPWLEGVAAGKTPEAASPRCSFFLFQAGTLSVQPLLT